MMKGFLTFSLLLVLISSATASKAGTNVIIEYHHVIEPHRLEECSQLVFTSTILQPGSLEGLLYRV